MSLLLTENPVQTVGGVVQNVFAGFLPVEFLFKREDTQVVNVGLGVDTFVRITIGEDLRNDLEVGDSIYLSAVGVDGYEYDASGAITAITASTIDAEIDFIEEANSGYINWKKDYYVEGKLVNPDNTNIDVLGFTVKDDGDPAGNITLDVNPANDKNDIDFIFDTTEDTDSRIKFKVQYREVFEGSSESFATIADEVIVVYATEQPEIEVFLNALDEPKIWKGYDFVSVFCHSDENAEDDGLQFVYDELDINQNDVTTDNAINYIDADKYGFIFAHIDKSNTYDSDTEYLKIKVSYQDLPFFSAAFFDGAFFETT